MPARIEPDSPDALGRTDAGTVLAGTSWTTVAAVVPPLQVLVISIVAARFLGTSGFGRQSLIAFVGISVSTVFAARMPAALSRFGAQLLGAGQGGATHWLFRWTWRVQVVSAVLVIAGFTAAALLGATPRLAWIAAGVATALMVLQNALSGLLVAAQRWRESIMPGTVITLVTCVIMVVVLAEGGGISGYFIVEVGLASAGLAWTWWLVRPLVRALPPPVRISADLRGDFRRFMRTSAFFALIEFVVLSRVEVIFLDRFSTTAQVGFYSVAFAASAAVARLPNVITTVAIPTVASLYGSGESERIRRGYWRSLRLLAALCPVLIALSAALGTDLIGFAYGAKFHPAEPVLALLLIPYLVMPMMGLSDAVLWTLQRMRFLVVWGIAAVAVDIGLGFVLVPSLHAVGAAIDNDLALLTSGVPTLWLAAKLMAPTDLNYATIARSAALALLGGAVALAPIVLLGGILGFMIGLIASLLVSWTAATRGGILDVEDAEWLAEVLRGRLGGRLSAFVLRFAI